jgi:SAM-dependent methyltransferase
MRHEPLPPTDPPGGGREVYSQSDNPDFEAQLARRDVTREASFLLRYLRPGMRVLDVGCGPGSITLGLAEVVAPGEVVGVDLQRTQVERAQKLAAERGVTNARFQVADVYALPFPDGTFDAALAHTVLMGLREPVRALREMRRVLHPAGIAGLRDPDWGADLLFPTPPLWEDWHRLRLRVRQHNGGDPYLGRQHRRLLLEAGFARVEAGATVESAGIQAECRRYVGFLTAQLRGYARTVLEEGWADRETLDAIAAAIAEWGEYPDAFMARIYCEAVGWAGKGALPP